MGIEVSKDAFYKKQLFYISFNGFKVDKCLLLDDGMALAYFNYQR